jgi:hypothetical protein
MSVFLLLLLHSGEKLNPKTWFTLLLILDQHTDQCLFELLWFYYFYNISFEERSQEGDISSSVPFPTTCSKAQLKVTALTIIYFQTDLTRKHVATRYTRSLYSTHGYTWKVLFMEPVDRKLNLLQNCEIVVSHNNVELQCSISNVISLIFIILNWNTNAQCNGNFESKFF